LASPRVGDANIAGRVFRCCVGWDRQCSTALRHQRGRSRASGTTYADNYHKNPDGTDVVYYSWALGYMSALNSMSPERFLDLNAETTDDGKRFLREYCNAHPLANYMDGVVELISRFQSLSAKNSSSEWGRHYINAITIAAATSADTPLHIMQRKKYFIARERGSRLSVPTPVKRTPAHLGTPPGAAAGVPNSGRAPWCAMKFRRTLSFAG
jgi:hypothetical protein